MLIDERYGKSDTDLMEDIKRVLSRYHIPRYVFRLKEIPMSGNAKLNRAECRRVADLMIKQKEA